MGSRHRRQDRLRPARFAIERLEGRDLPTPMVLLTGPVGARRGVNPRPIAAAEVATTPMPTPHEVARQRFNAKFSGNFITGPGRYTDQASQVYITGGGNSTAFLKGDLQLSIFIPRDPNGVVTGEAALYPSNAGSTGSALFLDLTGDPSSLDRHGRPTRLNWKVNISSSGLFSNASGEGTVDFRYRPGHGKLPARALSSGGAGVIFQGNLDTSGVADLLR